MKLRIRGNSVRFRLSKSEVAVLAEKGSVISQTDFGNSQLFSYSIRSTDDVISAEVRFENGCIEVSVPRSIAEEWAKSEEISISANDKLVRILIEKDFACLSVRENEDETDMFPNPEIRTAKC